MTAASGNWVWRRISFLQSPEYRIWLALLMVIAVCCAVASFGYFATYPLLRETAGDIADSGFLIFTITAPVVLGAALFAPGRQWTAAAKVHASLYAAFIVVLFVTSEPGHSSPGDGLAGLILILLFGILIFELVVVFIAVRRSPVADRELATPWLLSGLTVALLVGWGRGFWLGPRPFRRGSSPQPNVRPATSPIACW
jgi:hypothetical protein